MAEMARPRTSNTRRDSGFTMQIEIPLPVANLDICQPVPLLRQRQVALAEKLEPARPDGQLVGLGPEQMTRDADVVTEVEQR